MKKIIIATALLLGMFFLLAFVQKRANENKEKVSEAQLSLSALVQEKNELSLELEDQKKQNKKLEEKISQEKEYTMIAVGDIMLDRGVEKVLKNKGADYNFPFEKISKYLNSADYVFGNLEGSLSDIGYDQGGKYSFRFEPAAASALKNAGFDILSLANNHILDWGRDSVCATTKNLEKEYISFVGAGCNKVEAEQEKIFTLGDTRIALVAYSEFHPGWSWAGADYPGMSAWEPKNIRVKISELKKDQNIDLVFVSVHWGAEYVNRAPERIVKLGQSFTDAGADLVIGHHPHVDQELERYGDSWILYSLGNFVFDQSWSENTMEGLVAEIKIKNKKISDIIPKKIYLNEFYQPGFGN